MQDSCDFKFYEFGGQTGQTQNSTVGGLMFRRRRDHLARW